MVYVLQLGLQWRSPKNRNNLLPRARLRGVGNSHGFVAATRSDCFASLTHHRKNDLRPLQSSYENTIFMHLGAPPAHELLVRNAGYRAKLSLGEEDSI